jgi:hypothetical protein
MPLAHGHLRCNGLADEDDPPTKISVKRHVALARRRDKLTVSMRCALRCRGSPAAALFAVAGFAAWCT